MENIRMIEKTEHTTQTKCLSVSIQDLNKIMEQPAIKKGNLLFDERERELKKQMETAIVRYFKYILPFNYRAAKIVIKWLNGIIASMKQDYLDNGSF